MGAAGAGLCGDAVARTAADVNGFRFEKVTTTDDPMMLPGGAEVRRPAGAGGAGGAGRTVSSTISTARGMGHWMKAVYAAAGAADKLAQDDRGAAADAAKWLVR